MTVFERSPGCVESCQKAQVLDQLVETGGLRGLEAARALSGSCTDTCAALLVDQTIVIVNQYADQINRGDSSGINPTN